MRTAVENHINDNLPFLKGKKILIAISGGIDSIVLTHIFHKLKFDISLAHCNFSLRGKESNKDEQFVIELGEKLKKETFTIVFNTEEYSKENNVSTQMAARDLRYNWFQKLSVENGFEYILTAHQKDDVIETFLINLTRGTGLDGLNGIPEINGNIVRPLLNFSRNEILVYATKNKLNWREDSSNSSIKYTRNKIRHKVVPVLKELNPSLLESFHNTLENLNDSRQLINDRIKAVSAKIITKIENETHYNCDEILKLNNPKAYLYEFLKDFNFTQWSDIVDLLSAQTGKQILSSTHRLLKNRDVLILTEIAKEPAPKEYEITKGTSKITTPINLKFKVEHVVNGGKSKTNAFDFFLSKTENTMTVDLDKLTFPLKLRKWQKGDYFYPIGLNGKKKLSKFFKDEKLSLLEKENTWLLTSNNEIVWVIGNRLDDRFKVSKKTQSVLTISR
ncbi:tRNA(Ile)-lysidine synthase [Lutibacter oricola]|uniref:tRNA(Ile)-lysidine synthase n=1 Tax=Lutibacter oricola TaxID=762486 RepID=A0A1H3EF45_9FLAO|nr:tRNA lysidine(34) synthetase TilS [Lutibacter oricola]SDX77363.1 tRNA(Ile)-lysidine synthase [Lutibacter oricola]